MVKPQTNSAQSKPETEPEPGIVKVRALKDDIYLNPSLGRVKKGAEQVMPRGVAEHWARAGILEIIEG